MDIKEELQTKETIQKLTNEELMHYLNTFALLLGCKKYAKKRGVYGNMVYLIDGGYVLWHQDDDSGTNVYFTLTMLEKEAERRHMPSLFVGCLRQNRIFECSDSEEGIVRIEEVQYTEKMKDRCIYISFGDSWFSDDTFKLKWYWYDVYGDKHEIKVYGLPPRTTEEE